MRWHVIEIYEDKKKSTVQSSLDEFVRKAKRSAPYTAIHLLQ
jgi:hypothetical protein